MELLETANYFIFVKGENSLWCNRKTGQLEPRKGNHDGLIKLSD